MKRRFHLDRPPFRPTPHIRIRRTRAAAGGLLTILLLLLIVPNYGLFLNSADISASSRIPLFVTALLACPLIGLSTAVSFDLPQRGIRIFSMVLYFLMPVAAMCMSEWMQGVFIYDYSPQTFFLNYMLFLVLYSIAAVFSGKIRTPILVMTPVIYALSFVANMVLTFRGTPLMPADVITIRTGLAVASGYHYEITGYFLLSTLILIECFILGRRLPKSRVRRSYHHLFRFVSLALILCTIIPFYTTDILANAGVKPDFWNQARGYRRSGTLFNFVLNSKYLIVETPEEYDASEISSTMEAVLEENSDDPGIFASAQEMQARAEEQAEEEAALEQDPASESDPSADAARSDTRNSAGDISSDPEDSAAEQALPNTGLDTPLAVTGTSSTNQPKTSAALKEGEKPDIIVIMNETLSDLRVLGDLSTNKDYMPFLRNLTKNTIKGNLYLPVNGAGTSNSEFEFLTGNSMAFLTSGSNAYELYIKTKTPSVAHTLASLGYSRTGYHTYYGESWKRNVNYPLLGFENFYALEDVLDTETVIDYKNNDISFFEYQRRINERYPDENVLLRRFVSDEYDYKVLNEMYENRNTDYPFFMFNVTMQNHGGYDLSYANFDEQIRITSAERYYPKANRYLSLIYESDKAFEQLIQYYSSVSRPVMIVMFGDHQPSIETEFIEELLGKEISDLTTEENQKRYITPFLIWTNYNSQSGYIDKMSANYLSTLMLQQAGLPTTSYNDYLSAMYRSLPVIDTNGYITSDNRYYTFDDDTDYTELLAGYNRIEYNNLLDTLGRVDSLYYLDPVS